jgi:hypothetical protein
MSIKQVLVITAAGELCCDGCGAPARPRAAGTACRVILHTDSCRSVRPPDHADVRPAGAGPEIATRIPGTP